jgi:hypothetical protein
MRLLKIVGLIALAAGAASGALAQSADYSGKWLFSGLILSGRTAVSFAQVCDITETGSQVAGLCKGPNGGCSAVGVVSGGSVDLTCQMTNVNNPSLSGVLTFHGAVAPDSVIRGTVVHSKAPGASGQASMMRL